MSAEYMSESELETIAQFPLVPDTTSVCHHLLQSIKPYWERYGAFKQTSRNSYYLATGGWSGNEDIIGALKKNYMFWSLCWYKSQRGGAFWFKIPVIKGGKK